jgi:hypothetical protein
MRRAEPGSSQKLESRIPGNSYVRFGGERSEKGWPRYRQKFLLAGQSNKQYLAGPLPYFESEVIGVHFTLISHFFARRLVKLSSNADLPEQLSQVATTGYRDAAVGGGFRFPDLDNRLLLLLK